MSLLSDIQQKLKSPKSNTNSFGGYKYRSCEDILEAVKPLLPVDAALILDDEIVAVADRVYVRAKARLFVENGPAWSATAYAREPLEKKGSDASQITGAASSYARKYALNGLFLIDDTKDSDATNDHGKGQPEPKSHGKASVKLVSEINQLKTTVEAKAWWHANEDEILNMSEEQADEIDHQFKIKLKRLESGDTAAGSFKFGGVDESRAWVEEFKPKIDACTTPIALSNLLAANKPRLDAVLGQKDAKSDKDSLREYVADKKASFNVLEAG